MDTYAELLIQLPVVGLFMLWTWHGNKEWRSEMKEAEIRFETSLSMIAAKHEKSYAQVTRQVNLLSTLLVAHDARVRGINPDVAGEPKEILELLRREMKLNA